MMELEIMMLSDINQAQKANTACFHSFVKSKPKMMMMMMMMVMMITGHEYKGGLGWGVDREGRNKRPMRGDKDRDIGRQQA
jgi:hypothetical protein